MYPYLGFGLGLRPDHYQTILTNLPAVDWFEFITEDYLIEGGRPLYYLEQIRSHYPLVMHGVSLSIGGTDALDYEYLAKVKQLAKHIQPAWISDHCCWTSTQGTNLHDLMPMPYTEEAIKHLVERIRIVQDFLGQQIALENVSSYITYVESIMSEWEFLTAVAEEADCLLLLDINNVYVSSFNHHFDPLEFLAGIPTHRVQQFHLAGHQNFGNYIIDTHDQPIIENVWKLYAEAVNRFGKVSTLIERDDNIPPLEELISELNRAQHIATSVLAT